MSLTAVQDPPESESEDGPDSDQGEPNAAWPSSSFHFRSGTPRSRHSSPGHSPRPGTGSGHTRFGDADSQTTSFWGGLSVQRRSGTRKVERAWYGKKRVKGIVGVIGLLVLYFVMNWVMLLRLQDHRFHSKSWFSGKSSSSPAPISEKLKRYGKGKKPVKGYERMLALAAHALAEWFFDMDRAQLVLVALPILLFCRDISTFSHLDLQNLPSIIITRLLILMNQTLIPNPNSNRFSKSRLNSQFSRNPMALEKLA